MKATVFSRLLVVTPLILLLLVYWFTAADLPQGYADAEDLMLAIGLGGSAHPPGYDLLVWPLHLIVREFPASIWYVIVSRAMGVLTVVSVGLMGLLAYLLMDSRREDRWGILWGGLLWGVFGSTWLHATVPEIFSLATCLLLVYLIGMVGIISSRHWGWWIAGIAGAVGCWYHPLLWLIVLPSAGILVLWHRKQIVVLSRFLVIFVVVFGILVSLPIQRGTYSWVEEADWWDRVHTYFRIPYANDGSAIEVYANEVDIRHSAASLGVWVHMVREDIGLYGLVFGGLGMVWLWKYKRGYACIFGLLMIITGPLLVMYMKYPLWNSVYEPAYFWGAALRYRMSYIFVALMGLVAAIGFGWLWRRFAGQARIASVIMIMLPVSIIVLNYDTHDLSSANLVSEYLIHVYESAESGAVVVVDSDLIFSFWYGQLAGVLPNDVTFVTYRLPDSLQRAIYPDRRMPALPRQENLVSYGADLTAALLSQGYKVYLYAPKAELISLLGMEGNPFLGMVSGYLLEIGMQPTAFWGEYGISLQLVDMDVGDYWLRGFAGHVASIHSILGYFAERAGEQEQGFMHYSVAESLVSSELAHKALRESRAVALERLDNLGSYLGYEIPSVEAYMAWAKDALVKNDRMATEYYLRRAILRYFTHTLPRQMYLEVFRYDPNNSDYAKVQIEYLNLLNSTQGVYR